MKKSEKGIDPEVLKSYNAGMEKNRLCTDLGLIEFARTCEILLEQLPPPPAVIYDIGGGYGVYSYWLTERGYTVWLYDISEKNIEMSRQLAHEKGLALAGNAVADARKVPRPDSTADAILFCGPLYHIIEYQERILALQECLRLLKPGGVLFSGAITRYATTLWATTVYGVRNQLLSDPDFLEMINREITDGRHIKKPNTAYKGLGNSFFHLPKELVAELSAAGFLENDVRGVIGPCWLVPNLDALWQEQAHREVILKIVRLLEREESILGLSTHLLAVSRKPK